jgi:hypothetical protein
MFRKIKLWLSPVLKDTADIRQAGVEERYIM